MSQLTLQEIIEVTPPHLKKNITQDLIDKLNNLSDNPVVAQSIRDNFITYTGVLREGKYKTEDYLNAVKYVTYKLLGHTNYDAYAKTFPDRYAQLKAEGYDEKTISSYVYAYNKGKLVNAILEQSLVPIWVLNQDAVQKAINTQVRLMTSAKSERVQAMAADSILNHLKKPQEVGPLVNIDIKDTSGLNELQESLNKLAEQQKELIRSGVSPKDIAGHKLMVKEEDIVDV